MPVAYWVAGDTGLKQTTEAAWQGVTLTAEEIACIVPIPEAVIDDASFDIWTELKPELAEAIAQVLDAAVFGGINKPASWPAAIEPAAITAGNTAEVGTSTPAQGGIVGDVGTAFDKVEADGYQVSGVAAVAAMKGLLRKARDANGQRLVEPGSPTIEGVPLSYLLPATVGATTRAIVGDFSLAVVGIRQDITYKILDQAVLSDAAGVVVYNLAATGHGGDARGRPLRLRDRCSGDEDRRLRLPVRGLAGRDLVGGGRLPPTLRCDGLPPIQAGGGAVAPCFAA